MPPFLKSRADRLPLNTHYRFGNRRVRSDIPLAALPTIPDLGDGATDIRIIQSAAHSLPRIRRWLHRWSNEGVTTLSMLRRDEGYLLRFPRLCDIHLHPAAGTVHVMRGERMEDHTLEHLLVDQVLPRMLAHQGELIAHASALVVHGRTVLFLGSSGAGKSTLAALMQRAGHQVLSDDCTLLLRQGDAVMALPTYPSLRLFPDSLEHAVPSGTASSAMARYSEKRRVHMDRVAARSWRVHAMYLLAGPASDSAQSIKTRRPSSACLDLIRHSFQLDVTDRSRTRELLAYCGDVARKVPAFTLNYPHDFEQSRALVEGLGTHIDTLRTH